MIIDLLESDYFSKLHLLICLLIIIKASTYEKIIVFLYLFCSIKLNSQKHDYVWLWGGYRSDSIEYNIYGNFLDFNNGVRNISTVKIKYDIDQVNNSMSDKNGNLYFTSMAAT